MHDLNPKSYDEAKARQQDLHRAAEQNRLAHASRSQNENTLTRTALKNLGRKLEQWGTQLQDQYGQPQAQQRKQRLAPEA